MKAILKIMQDQAKLLNENQKEHQTPGGLSLGFHSSRQS